MDTAKYCIEEVYMHEHKHHTHTHHPYTAAACTLKTSMRSERTEIISGFQPGPHTATNTAQLSTGYAEYLHLIHSPVNLRAGSPYTELRVDVVH